MTYHSFHILIISLFLFTGCNNENKAPQNVNTVSPEPVHKDTQSSSPIQMDSNFDQLIEKAFAEDKSCRKVFTGNKGNFSYPRLSYAKVFAYSFLEDLCYEDGESPLTTLLMSPSMGDKDVLSIPLFNKGSSKERNSANLIATYALVYSLGRRESSGNFYQGRDLTATNTQALTEEAGFIQVSANSLNLKGKTKESKNFLMDFFQSYILSLSSEEKSELSRSCLSNILGTESETKNFDSSGLKLHLLFHYGECHGLAQKIKEKKFSVDEKSAGCFRRLTKECPAFAIKYSASLVRIRRDHNGPLILHEEFGKGIDSKYLKPYLEPSCHGLFRAMTSSRDRLCSVKNGLR